MKNLEARIRTVLKITFEARQTPYNLRNDAQNSIVARFEAIMNELSTRVDSGLYV